MSVIVDDYHCHLFYTKYLNTFTGNLKKQTTIIQNVPNSFIMKIKMEAASYIEFRKMSVSPMKIFSTIDRCIAAIWG